MEQEADADPFDAVTPVALGEGYVDTDELFPLWSRGLMAGSFLLLLVFRFIFTVVPYIIAELFGVAFLGGLAATALFVQSMPAWARVTLLGVAALAGIGSISVGALAFA
ncbi:MAG: hypothetical protein ACPGQL_10475 [Thermoplasmatota archaeon]